MSEDLKPWPLRCYAPGGYFCTCADCGERFEGDKRAVQCLECAVLSQKRTIATKDAEIARLREALEPFRALADEVFERYETTPGVYREAYDTHPDDKPIWGFNDANITYGDLRGARAALSPIPDPAGGMPVEVET